MIELLGNLFAPLVALLGAGLQFFHGVGIPWWLAIVMLTFIVRTILLPLTIKQVRNMRQLQELKPELERIRKKHGKDAKKQQQATMELYAERNVSPLGGCLPALVQMPIFLGLYYTIKDFGKLSGLHQRRAIVVQGPDNGRSLLRFARHLRGNNDGGPGDHTEKHCSPAAPSNASSPAGLWGLYGYYGFPSRIVRLLDLEQPHNFRPERLDLHPIQESRR